MQADPGSVGVPAILLGAGGTPYRSRFERIRLRCDRRRLCLHPCPFHHRGLAAPFRFRDELGHAVGVGVRRVEPEPEIRKEPVF